MKKILCAVAMLVVSSQSFAQSLTGVLGLRQNHSIVDNMSSNDLIKFHGGVLYSLPINEVLSFRTGGLLAMKDGEVESGAIKVTVNRFFLDVPVTLQFGNDFVQGYAGFNFGVKLSSSCTSNIPGLNCTLQGEKSTVFQPVLGVDFTVAPQFTVGAFYELETVYQSDNGVDYKQTALGLNVGYKFN